MKSSIRQHTMDIREIAASTFESCVDSSVSTLFWWWCGIKTAEGCDLRH